MLVIPSPWRHRVGMSLLVALVLGPAVGCSRGPRAPALLDEPIYENRQEGFHFVTPDGWKMQSRTELPPGKLTEERSLVKYERQTGERSSSLEVSMADVPSETDLTTCLQQRAAAPAPWPLAKPMERLTLGGQPAARAIFVSPLPVEREVHEIVAVRHGSRVYYFTAVLPVGDTRARDEVRKALATLSW
jgi:hypothetical protein